MEEFNNNSEKETDKLIEGGIPFVTSLPPYAYVLLVLVIIFIIYQFIGGAMTYIALGTNFEKNLPLTRFIITFGQFFLILAPTILFARLQTKNLKDLFKLNLPSPLMLFLAMLGIAFINPVIQGYMTLQTSIIEQLPYYNEIIKPVKDLFDELDKATLKIVGSYSVIEFITVIFVIAVTPAICEELLFRGFVLTNMKRTANKKIAIFLTGFLFAIYHFQLFNLIPLVLLGVYLSFVVYYSNSIVTGIVSHFLNNFFAAYIMYLYGKDVNIPDVSENVAGQVLVVLTFLLLFIVTCFMIYKLGKLNLKKIPQTIDASDTHE